MNNKLDTRRIFVFVLFAFGFAWLTALVIALTGGIANSPVIIPGLRLTLALVLIAVVYMSAPALANVLTRVITHEGWSNTWLRPHFKCGWRYWLAVWLLVPLFILSGTAVYFLFFPSQFDPSLNRIRLMLPPGAETIHPWVLVAVQAIQGMFLSVLINAPFTFGEEFGWRAYLLQKLLPLGPRRAILVSGVIVGVWHWPVTAMGHNYGFAYPGFPVLGMLAMVWFAFVLAVLFSWAVLRARSVWPAVIGHAVLNGLGAIGNLVAAGDVNPLLGPIPAGIIGSLAFTLFALWVLISPRALPHELLPQSDISGSTPLRVVM